MTDEQKRQIHDLRQQGLGYMKIGQVMGISDNTVRSYCRRSRLPSSVVICPQCGRPVKHRTGHKPRRFCSDACRTAWWNSHLDQVDRKAVYQFVCVNCGKEFSAYGNAHRKYCSRACYIAHRFGGGGDA